MPLSKISASMKAFPASDNEFLEFVNKHVRPCYCEAASENEVKRFWSAIERTFNEPSKQTRDMNYSTVVSKFVCEVLLRKVAHPNGHNFIVGESCRKCLRELLEHSGLTLDNYFVSELGTNSTTHPVRLGNHAALAAMIRSHTNL